MEVSMSLSVSWQPKGKKSNYTRPYCEEPFLKACGFAWLAGVSEGCNDNSGLQEDVLYNKPKYQKEALHKVHGRDEFYIQVNCSFYSLFGVNLLRKWQFDQDYTFLTKMDHNLSNYSGPI